MIKVLSHIELIALSINFSNFTSVVTSGPQVHVKYEDSLIKRMYATLKCRYNKLAKNNDEINSLKTKRRNAELSIKSYHTTSVRQL